MLEEVSKKKVLRQRFGDLSILVAYPQCVWKNTKHQISVIHLSIISMLRFILTRGAIWVHRWDTTIPRVLGLSTPWTRHNFRERCTECITVNKCDTHVQSKGEVCLWCVGLVLWPHWAMEARSCYSLKYAWWRRQVQWKAHHAELALLPG